jgi:hypothetical protein
MKKLLILLCVSAFTVSCVKTDVKEVDSIASGPKIVGFANKIQQVAYFSDQGTVDVAVPVSLLGYGNGQLSSDAIVVNYAADAASTATAGVEYDFANTTGKVTIAPNTTFVNIPLKVHTGSLNPTAKTILLLNLTTTANGVVVGDQYKQLKVVFVGCQSQLAGTYTVVVTRNDGVTKTFTNEEITLVSTNYFKTTTTATYAPGTIANDQGYNFTDICGEINVAAQGLCQGTYSNTVSGISTDGVDGTVTDNNHFKVTYQVTFSAGNRTYTNVYSR